MQTIKGGKGNQSGKGMKKELILLAKNNVFKLRKGSMFFGVLVFSSQKGFSNITGNYKKFGSTILVSFWGLSLVRLT